MLGATKVALLGGKKLTFEEIYLNTAVCQMCSEFRTIVLKCVTTKGIIQKHVLAGLNWI